MSMKHGDTSRRGGVLKRTSEYSTWVSMRQRCSNPNAPGYQHYGGRGIGVCARWETHSAFLADMGRKPSPVHQIDRIDNDGWYEPSNCRWVLPYTQSRNRRSNNNITVGSDTKCVTDWGGALGVTPGAVAARIKSGMSPEQATSAPFREHHLTQISIDGEVRTVADWSRQSSVSAGAIRHRLELGWPEKGAVFCPPGVVAAGRKPSIFWTIDGVTRPASDWIADSGLKRTAVEARLKRGFSPKEALTMPLRKTARRQRPAP